MSTVTIATFNIPNCQYTGSTATLRIYYAQNFIASDSTPVIGGAVGSQNFYKEVACTIAADTLTVPQFTLISTDDTLNPLNLDIPVTAVFYQGTTQRDFLFSDYIIPASPASTTFSALSIFNDALVISYPPSYFLTRQQTVDLIGITAPAAHHTTHENGGSDEINVAGLSGLLADSQTPLAHKTSHENGGSDEINVAGLNGVLADPQTPITENVQDIVGAMATDTATVDFTYDDGAGTLTANVPDNAITYAKQQNVSAASRLIGRGSAAGAGDPEEITIGSGLSMSGTALSATGVSDGDKGDITVSASGATWTVDNDAITYAKIQDVSAADRLLGRGNGGGAGDVQEILLGTNLSLSGTTLNAAGGGSTSFAGIDKFSNV